MTRTADGLATAEDLLAGRYGNGGGELEGGVLLLREPAGLRHGAVAIRIGAALLQATRDASDVLVVGAETGFLVARGPDSVRAPDVAVITGPDAIHLARQPGFAPRAPDLAVEVRSPSDTLASQLDKASMWIARGSHLAWVVDPEEGVAYLLAKGASIRRVFPGEAITGEPVLPGVSIPLSELLI